MDTHYFRISSLIDRSIWLVLAFSELEIVCLQEQSMIISFSRTAKFDEMLDGYFLCRIHYTLLYFLSHFIVYVNFSLID